jgi:hypothetical protein
MSQIQLTRRQIYRVIRALEFELNPDFADSDSDNLAIQRIIDKLNNTLQA